jgi:hypothetical protein
MEIVDPHFLLDRVRLGFEERSDLRPTDGIRGRRSALGRTRDP